MELNPQILHLSQNRYAIASCLTGVILPETDRSHGTKLYGSAASAGNNHSRVSIHGNPDAPILLYPRFIAHPGVHLPLVLPTPPPRPLVFCE